MILKQLFKKLQFLVVLVSSYMLYAQCVVGTTPALSTFANQTATTLFNTGNVSLNGSVMGFTFLANAGNSNANRIGNDHNSAEYGIYISHPNGVATTPATSIQGAITFSSAVSGLRFIINDIDNNDFVRLRIFDENGISIPLVQNTNFTFLGGSANVVEYRTTGGIQEFYDDDNESSDDGDRDGSVSFNFTGRRVSKVEFDYYDTNNTGAITFARFEAFCIAANNDSYVATKGVGLTTTSVLTNDILNGAQATSSNVIVSPVGTLPPGFTLSAAGIITTNNTVVAGVYNIPYQICQTAQITNCSTAVAKITVFEDSDGDTVPNYLDLDDDNDGILDTDECQPNNIVNNGTFTGNITGWTAGTGWVYNAAGSQTATNESDVAVNSILSQSVTNLANVENGIVSLNLRVGAQDNANAANRSSTLEILLNGTVYATLRNGFLRNSTNITLDLATGVSSTFTTFGTGAANGFTYSAPFTINIPYTGPNTAILAFRMVAGPDDWSLDDISINASICDTDGDGIRDSLDTDSDGDGCFDAIEGDENVTAAQLTAGRISGAVSATGVPVLVNSGGTADIGGDIGQGFGYSKNNSLNACKDADGDGIIDNLDLDSDNDGVLDTDEGSFCGKIGRNIRVGYLATGAADDGLPTNLLLNLNNYGTYGTYKNVTGVTLVPFATAAAVTEAALVTNNIDVFFVGSTADENNNNAANTTFKAPTSVNNILTTWAKNTGKVIFAIQNNAVDFGYITTNNNLNNDVPFGTLGNQVYTTGYWPTPSLTQSGGVQMTISSTNRLFNTLMVDNTGKPVVVSDQEYNLVIFPDATIYIAEANEALPTTNDRKTIADTWAYVFDLLVSKQCTSINTDGDLLPNHLDLDSDGDGCSDAFEAGATTSLAANFAFASVAGTATDSNSDGLADVVDGTPLNGIPNYVSTYEIAKNASNRKCLDSDGDGILDTADLDDDNDGILDTDEGFACNSLNRNLRIGYLNTALGTTGLMINMLSNSANFSYTGTFKKFPGITFVPYATEAAITEAQLITDNIDLFYAGSSAADAQGTADKLSTAVNNRIQTWITNHNKGAIILQNNATDYGYQVTNNNTNNNVPYGVVGQRVFTNGYWPESTFAQSGAVQMTIASLTNVYDTAMVDAQGKATFIKDKNRKIVFFPDTTIFTDNVTASTINNATLRVAADIWAYAFDTYLQDICSSVDTDADGIPNYLDLDSDGDGCPDAREGAGDFNPTATASGPIAAQTPNINFGTAVNPTTGVPTVVGAGQAIGQAQDASRNDCLDSDGDTIPDWQDLDDDNDGIIDCLENGLGAGATATTVFELNGTANAISTNEIQLTAALGSEAGQMWSYGKIDFSKSFSLNYEARLGSNNEFGADGIAAVFHNSPLGVNALGSTGVGMGAQGIANGIVLEIDTFDNGAGTVGDIANDHGQIWVSSNQSGAGLLTTAADLGELEDGAWKAVVISWNFQTKTLSYTVGGINAGTYTFPASNPITSYFGGTSSVYFGYTASTGLYFNDQRIRFANFCNLPIELDTDGDGIPNRLDLDSDGDGCTDAIEGGNPITASSLVAVTTGPLSTQTPNQNLGNTVGNTGTTLGIPTIATTGQTIGNSQDVSKNDCLDSDGDSIPDWQDVDDDNDGILDTAENNCLNTIIAGYPATIPAITTLDFGLPFTGTAQNNLTVTADLSAKFGYPANSGAVIVKLFNAHVHPTSNEFYVRGDLPLTKWEISGSVASIIGIEHGSDYYPGQLRSINLRGNAPTVIAHTASVAGTWANTSAGNIYTLQNLTAARITNQGQLHYASAEYNVRKRFEIHTNESGPSRFSTYFIRLQPECDTDKDGIPNRLDLDSDADGCSDAFEGGANITVQQLVAAGGTVNGGSTTVTQNICTTCISTTGTNIGLPQFVTLPTGYSNTTGQSFGDSQNGAIGCFCTQPPAAGTGEITKVGISVQQRQVGWPENIPNGHIVLESKEKGLVITRVAHVSFVPQPTDSIVSPFAGMLVYDIQDLCVKLFNGVNWKCLERSCNTTSN